MNGYYYPADLLTLTGLNENELFGIDFNKVYI